jgi:hypothetical protein
VVEDITELVAVEVENISEVVAVVEDISVVSSGGVGSYRGCSGGDGGHY